MITNFAAADANQDGRLDFNEFKSFTLNCYQSLTSRGVPDHDPSLVPDDRMNETYQELNGINDIAEGVSFCEMTEWGSALGAKLTELIGC